MSEIARLREADGLVDNNDAFAAPRPRPQSVGGDILVMAVVALFFVMAAFAGGM